MDLYFQEPWKELPVLQSWKILEKCLLEMLTSPISFLNLRPGRDGHRGPRHPFGTISVP